MTPEAPRPTHKKATNSQLLGEAAVLMLWPAIREGVTRPRVEDPNNYFQEARDHLESGNPLVAYINHSTFVDVIAIGQIMKEQQIPLDHLAAIISINQFDNQEGYQAPEGSIRQKALSEFAHHVRRGEYWLIESASRRMGFKLLPIIREKDIASNPERYGQPSPATNWLTPKEFNDVSVKEAQRIVLGPGNVIMLAPEGGVNQDGVMTKADEGTGALLRHGRGKNLKAMGIALSPRRYTNVVAKPTKLFSYDEASELRAGLQEKARQTGIVDEKGNVIRVTLSDALMVPVAAELSPEYRGYYAPLVAAAA